MHFRKLLREERRNHKRQAETLAYEAKRYLENRAKQNRVKSKEELEQEVFVRNLSMYRSVVKDIDKLWSAVFAEVRALRLKEFEEQQQAKMKGHLARVLDRTDQMLNRGSELDSFMTDSEEEPLSTNESEDSEQMSDSDLQSSSEDEALHDDGEMTVEELRMKYANVPELKRQSMTDTLMTSQLATPDANADEDSDSDPETEMDSEFDTDDEDDDDQEGSEDENESHDFHNGLLSLFTQQEVAEMAPEQDKNVKIDPEHLSTSSNGSSRTGHVSADEEDSDPDVEMDSEFDTDGTEGESLEDEDDVDHDGGSLLSLFTNQQATGMASLEASQDPNDENDIEFNPRNSSSPMETALVEEAEARATQPQSLHGLVEPAHHQRLTAVIAQDEENLESHESSEDQISHGSSTQASPAAAAEPESVSSVEPQNEVLVTAKDTDDTLTIDTPVPKLLRGKLRIYQHEGLDWLANLYANGRSGILADEMGLGKTIQSISLLAHLAEVYEVWGPHLIVVPTSVMLNWEMEFKKFLPGFKILTYYGSLDERKQKRRGWLADDSFNVCITSYQLVLQDANSFKRRRWHYMILDEAHNIKNFRSERWQTMMTFNTRARLLLTGTPLQNNLTELWSLLFFLHYGQETEGEDDAFAGLKEWSEWFKRPVESILEHNKQILDAEDKEQVAKLHKVIRPFLLRRLKADVEKQMPLKYEHVELCRLSKRQRQLYDGFMSRAQTKETLASGNYLSIINALMQLRKVCNHPDLFETRPINTSFAMPKPVATDFEIQDLLVRKRLLEGADELNLGFLQLVPICNERKSMIEFQESTSRHAYHQLKALYDQQWRRSRVDGVWHGESQKAILDSLENAGRRSRLVELNRTIYVEAYRHHEHPVYGRGLIQQLTVSTTYDKLAKTCNQQNKGRFWERQDPTSSLTLVQSVLKRSEQMQPLVEKYACLTPAVVANELSTLAVTEAGSDTIRQSSVSLSPDPFHEARMKLSIAFPDKRLLQYDCGKLQRLDKLLRQLQSGGHRALIFTQMTKVLDILEQFLNIHGHRYLRLDGSTKIEQRQMLTERFNNDTRILAFILSSRSGGLGINLTGADTVIFYDLDWNPAMDKQCTDRAHRIGQTRDVHIYRFVSEHTIESNILRKANQKQLLDDVVIQEGDFTTDYLTKLSYRDMLDYNAGDDVAGAAMDRVLGTDRSNVAAFEQAEDKEDIAAAKVASREVQHADDGDFEDSIVVAPREGEAPGPMAGTNMALAEADSSEDGIRHVDEYMLRFQRFLLREVPLGPPKDRKKGKKRRDEHRLRRIR
jgi:helicase SWR1